jgi:hypothetical protein
MKKKQFIALADSIKAQQLHAQREGYTAFTEDQLAALADFCQSQNPQFTRSRWLGYIAGENGNNGGKR